MEKTLTMTEKDLSGVMDQAAEKVAQKTLETVEAKNAEQMEKYQKAQEKMTSIVTELKNQHEMVQKHGTMKEANRALKRKDFAQYFKNMLDRVPNVWDGVESHQKLVHTGTDIGLDDLGTFNLVFPEYDKQIYEDMCRNNYVGQWMDRRTTKSNLIKINMEIEDVNAFHVDECTTKPVDETKIEQIEARPSKAAVILLACDELLEDASVDDFEGFLIRKIADAFRRLENKDILIADGAGVDGTSVNFVGVINADTLTGTAYKNGPANLVVTPSTNIKDITIDNLIDATFLVDSCSAQGAAWYMDRSTFQSIAKIKDNDGRYYFWNEMNKTEPVVFGYPVRFVDEMPKPTFTGGVPDASSDTKYIIFGDLMNARFYLRKGLEYAESKHASVVDNNAQLRHLFQENITAIRGEKRYVPVVMKPSAFSIIKTALV